MEAMHDTAEMCVGTQAIDAYSRLNYTMWFALAEFVDNSTQSRFNYDSVVTEILEGSPLEVKIDHNRIDKSITIADNSIGMSKDSLKAALQIAVPTKDSKGRSKYGMGMKTAACWIGRKWTVTTCLWGSGEEWTATIDVDEIVKHGAKVPLTLKKVDTDQHYTKITITNLRRVIQGRTEETIRMYLGSMYMFDLRPDEKGKSTLKLTYNGEEITPPLESEWDTDPTGKIMRRDLPEIRIGVNGDKLVKGWVGVLRKGGRKFGGFSLYQNERQIQGFPHAWKPKTIFGGVDDEGANNLVAQRLTGVIQLEGFIVSHTKDAILFQDEEENQLEEFLFKQTEELAAYAKSRRSSERGQKWSKEQVRELVKDMQSEFTSAEMKDALTNASLPPFEIIAANNKQLLDSLQADDEIGRLEILPDLVVIMALKEISQFEPYVTFSIAAETGLLYVIINGLHPYYQTLEAKDSIYECVQQYILDAVAEYKVSKMTSRINPDSIRILKDKLLRVRSEQLENADAEVRAKAVTELFGRSTNSK